MAEVIVVLNWFWPWFLPPQYLCVSVWAMLQLQCYEGNTWFLCSDLSELAYFSILQHCKWLSDFKKKISQTPFDMHTPDSIQHTSHVIEVKTEHEQIDVLLNQIKLRKETKTISSCWWQSFLEIVLLVQSYLMYIHYLISIWTTRWWNWSKIVWSEPYKILCFLTKMVNNFWRSVDAILEDVSVTEKHLFDAKLLI